MKRLVSFHSQYYAIKETGDINAVNVQLRFLNNVWFKCIQVSKKGS